MKNDLIAIQMESGREMIEYSWRGGHQKKQYEMNTMVKWGKGEIGE